MSLNRREQNRKRTRERLISVAYRRFLEQGFDNTTVDEIVDEAGVSQRTFFRYFSSKEAIVFHLHADRIQRFKDLLDSHTESADPLGVLFGCLMEMGRYYFLNREELLLEWRIVVGSHALVGRDVELDYEYEHAISQFLVHHSSFDRFRANLYAGAMFGAVRAVMREWFLLNCEMDLVALGHDTLSLLFQHWRAAEQQHHQ